MRWGAEVTALRRHVGTFSGCGGSSEGVRMTGRFVTTEAVEFDRNAGAVYRANHPTTTLIDRSIVEVTAADFAAGQVDLLEGSPPCSKFSVAGKREKSWGKVTKSDSSAQLVANVEDLFFEFCRLVEGLQPKAFVAENVPGLAIGAGRGYLIEIVARLNRAGYATRVAVVNASAVGVASRRSRLFIMGLHQDYQLRPPLPDLSSVQPVTIGDVCPWVDRLVAKLKFTNLGSGDLTIVSFPSTGPAATILSNGYAGSGIDQVGVERHGEHPTEGLDPDEVETAVVTAVTGRAYERRTGRQLWRPTILELKRLSSFPDAYQFSGSYTQRWARIGNAVPPLLAAYMANHMADLLDTVDPR